MKTININGNQINVEVKESPRTRKTVKIEFKSTEKLIITIPKDSEIDVDELIKKYRGQITKKHQILRAVKPVIEDNQILFKGKPRKIEYIKTENNQRVKLSDDSIKIFHHETTRPMSLLKKWMIEETKKIIKKVQEEHPELENPVRISVADTSRWGYTRENVIIYNWQIAALPERLAEYVILHELVHLEHMNHGKKFKTEMIKILPEYKEIEKQIKKYEIKK
jgi:hypothetical protein